MNGGTAAIAALRRAGVPFAVHEFRHQHGATDYGDEAACARGVGKLSLKSLAAALGAKRAEMMPVADAARITGTA